MAGKRSKVLINCDMGEAFGNYVCGPDQELMPLIDLANIACGFHAGDAIVMERTVALCKAHKVLPGAHPSLPDLQGFGRREMLLRAEEHRANVVYQVGALRAFVEREGLDLHHVKPHGVLYGMMARDDNVARAVWSALPRGTRVLGLAGTAMERAALECGLEFWAEGYADVAYRADGSLIITKDRRAEGHRSLDAVRAHVRRQVFEGSVTADDGSTVALGLNDYPLSICCHSDSPGCLEIVRAARDVVDEFNASELCVS
ncbi:hypothetical protein CDD81_1034 [Ophiocordyceps australis]|uniref:Lactam utilization protein lamB n=1 Tax=Ophiocordyceps australis TaxID=1399860 RepID=A0A2C5XZV3_9HYPO|nr:hypothetical protein CDD81_1034 [Ophiocordyceps australis]